jgi:hypothetical protein
MRDDHRKPGGASADDSGSGTTIVGGQPPGRPRRALQDVPVGLERVLYLAASDPGFRQALLRDRDAAVDARGFPLLPSERTALKVASTEQLEAAIRGLDVSAPSLERRGFMRSVAASAVTLAAVNALSGCDRAPVPGVPDNGPVMAGMDRSQPPWEGPPIAGDRPGDGPGPRWEGPLAGIRPLERGPDAPQDGANHSDRPRDGGADGAKKG